MDSFVMLTEDYWQWLLNAIALRSWAILKIIIFFLAVRFIAYRLINRTIKSLIKRKIGAPSPDISGRVITLGSLVRSIVFYVLVFISGVMFLRVFDVDPTPVLTAAGVVGLAVGFGAQRLVRDIISGFFIILENQYSVGDYVTIGAFTGVISELGMRVTHIRDETGRLIIMANGDITTVINHSRGPLQAILEINVAADSDIEKVRSIINEIGEDVCKRIDGVATPPKADGITAVDAVKMTLRITGEVTPGCQFEVQSALREMIRNKFADEEIKLL